MKTGFRPSKSCFVLLAVILASFPMCSAFADPQPCADNNDPFGQIHNAVGDVDEVTQQVAGIGAAAAPSLTVPVAGFPLYNSDAYVGPRGYLNVISVATVSRSGGSRDFSGPYTEVMYNPIDNLQVNASQGGVLADRTNGVNTVAAGDGSIGAKYNFYDNPNVGLAVAAGIQVTVNAGQRAVNAGLTNAGPVTSASLYASKILSEKDTVSLDLTKTSGPHGVGEWDYGPVIAHQASDKLTEFAEMVGRRSDQTGDSALSVAVGIAYQLNQHFSAGAGISHSVMTSGDTYTPGDAVMVGVSYNN